MVGVAGFEPATPASRTQCSTRLSHTPTWRAAYRGATGPSQVRFPTPKKRSSKRRCIHPTPALSPPPRQALRGFAVPAGEWCNGNTAVFGTVVLGSSPSSPATSLSHRLRARLVRRASLPGGNATCCARDRSESAATLTLKVEPMLWRGPCDDFCCSGDSRGCTGLSILTVQAV